MTLTPEELHRIAARTLVHYEHNAAGYREGTRDHDVRQNIEALLARIDVPPPFMLLDFGCGPGRDLSAFKALGHRVIGLDGSPRLAAMARKYSGCEVLEQSFLELDLPRSRFDGVFANAVLFSSNPRGTGQEGWSGNRYGAFHDWEAWRGYMTAAGFVELDHFYRPAGLPLEMQPWLASVWRKEAGGSARERCVAMVPGGDA